MTLRIVFLPAIPVSGILIFALVMGYPQVLDLMLYCGIGSGVVGLISAAIGYGANEPTARTVAKYTGVAAVLFLGGIVVVAVIVVVMFFLGFMSAASG